MNKSSLAVILVDMQDFFLKQFPLKLRSELIANQLKILNVCAKQNIPLVVLEYKAGGKLRGETTEALRKKIKNASLSIIVKEHNGGFTKTNLDQILKSMHCKKILIMGINASGCIQDTAMSAHKRGYQVIVSKGLMANTWRKDMNLSKQNEEWYRSNCILFEGVEDTLRLIANY